VAASDPGAQYFGKNTVGSNTVASYPCLIVNPAPTSLQYGFVGTVNSEVIRMQGVDPTDDTPVNISKIELSWQDNGTGISFAPSGGCDSFYPATALSGTTWTYTGILRAELVPLNSLSRDGLTSAAYTAFLCPSAGSVGSIATSDYASNIGNNEGVIIPGNCNTNNPGNSPSSSPPDQTPNYCNTEIINLDSLNQSSFFLILRSVYSATSATVIAYDSSGRQLGLEGAQTLVDSTGKAQDTLRRIQARVPTYNGYDYADFDLETTGDICKQLQLTPTGNDNAASLTCPTN
jgi:hypothetical protein